MMANEEGRIDIVELFVNGADIDTCRNDGVTPLHLAAYKGHVDVVQFLIEQHADVNACDIDGESCLLTAVWRGHIDVVRALVSAGADVNLKCNDGASPLGVASEEGHIDIVKVFVNSGAGNNKGETPLWCAALNGQVEVVQFFIEQHADVNACDSSGESCLLQGVWGGHIDVVRALVSAGADVILKRNDGVSPLEVASHEGHIDIVKLFVNSGAEIDTCDNDGETPLNWAAYNGHLEVVQLLIEQHADVNSCGSGGESCLLAAVWGKHIDAVRALVSAGADVNLKCNDGVSPLGLASEEGHIDIVKLFVNSGADIDTCNNKGKTPLYLAAYKGHVDVVQFLIEQHADVNACDSSGRSCLMVAVWGGHIDVVRALVSAGADVNLKRNDGVSPLGVACWKGHTDIVAALLDESADIEMRDNDGCTALWFAASCGLSDVVNVLIAHGADVDAVDYRRRSPVYAAAIPGHIDAVNTLIHHNANMRNKEGNFQNPLIEVAERAKREVNPMLQLLINNSAYVGAASDCVNGAALVCAVCNGHLDVVKMIVENGANIHMRDIDNLQAIDYASYCGHVSIMSFLGDICADCTNTFHSIYLQCNGFSESLSSDFHTDCHCNTAIHLTHDLQCMRLLLENGADVEAENVEGLRPIHCAVRTGVVELVELLIQHGANVDAADEFGNRPLHDAVCHKLKIVQLLGQHGAKLNVQNVDGKTPLHIAIERQQSDVIKFLLTEDVDIGLTDVWRNTPLHYLTADQLICNKLGDCIVKQTEKYQHVVMRNAVGMTAILHGTLDCYIHKTESYDSRNISGSCSKQQMKRLLKTEVYCRKAMLVSKPTYVDWYGNTPLHHAVGVYGYLKIGRVSPDVTKTVNALVMCGTDINAQNEDGLTPLHVARGEQAIKACLQHANDQSFTVTDKRGRNFWHLLFLSRNQNEFELATTIQPLIHNSCAKYSVDDLNRTPLHYACMDRNPAIAERIWLAVDFVLKFSDEHINKQDKFGRTALHYAAMAIKRTELMKLLKTKESIDDAVVDNFDKKADQYKDLWCIYDVKLSLLRLTDTSSFVAKNVGLISVCIQECFSDTTRNSQSSTSKLRGIIGDLRGCSCISYVLNTYLGCQLDYTDDLSRRAMAAWKQRRCERAESLAVNNFSATQSASMFTMIQSLVDESMKYLAREILHKDNRFACELIPVGSAYEGTKIGCCDEFDYNFVLTNLSKRCKVSYSPESPPGFLLLKALTPDFDEDLFNSNGILNTRIVKFRFETLVKQILSSLEFCEETGFEFIDPVHDFIRPPPGTISTKISTHIKLAFTKPVNGYHVLHDVSVDVVPALRIDGWWPDDIHRKDVCQIGDCLIVFTQPQIKYPWVGWTEPHGFISFARAESRLLRDCRAVIKAAYMVVKRMSKYFCQYQFFSSHVIKTALFWCLDEEDFIGNPSSSSQDSDEVEEDELLRLVQKIIRRLLCFAAQDFVPYYFLPKCRQPVWLKEIYLKEFHMRLYRHGLLAYKDIFSLNEQQSEDEKLQTIKSLFIFSHVMYWSVLSDTDEFELFVPSTINPLTENSDCTTLLPGQ